MKKVRCCILCKHFSFDEGSPGYSEYTPGTDWSMSCLKNHWSMSGSYISEEDYRKNILMAETCKDAEEKKIVK